MRSCHGFTLLESIIAFLILSVFTALSVNIVTQNSMRLSKVKDTYELINQLDTVMSLVKKDIISGRIKTTYNASTANGYDWIAGVREIQNPGAGNRINKQQARLYEIDVHIRGKNKTPGIHVKNVFLSGV